jgi:KDO2-lipid IV(A) lauroyltransferase
MVNELHKTARIQFHTGHFFNWEFVNLEIAKNFKGRFIGVYMPMTNKAINKLMLQMRGQFNTILVSAHEFRTAFIYNKDYFWDYSDQSFNQ